MASARKGTKAFLSGRIAQQTLLKAALACACAMTAMAANVVCFNNPGLQFSSCGQPTRQHLVTPASPAGFYQRPPSSRFASCVFPWVLAGCTFFVQRKQASRCLQATDRDFEMEQAKLRIEQVLHEKQCLEEEKQQASGRVKSLEKDITDLRSELQASQQQISQNLQASRQESAGLEVALEKCRLLEQDKSEVLSQNKALHQTLKVLNKDLQDYQQKTASHGFEVEQTSSRLQEVQATANAFEREKNAALARVRALENSLENTTIDVATSKQSLQSTRQGEQEASSRLQQVQATANAFEREKDAALARVRALEKSLEDTMTDVATSKQNLQSTRQGEQEASAALDDIAAERDALKSQVQSLRDTMSNIMALASGKLTDPEDDPFVLLERTREEAAAVKLRAKEMDTEKTAAVAQRDEALVELELRSTSLESLELRSRSLEDSEARAQRLSKLLQEVATAVGASPGFFDFFKSKKTDEDMAEDIKAKIKELVRQR